MQGKEGKQAYIPALKYNWLTALYDPLLRWTLRERTFKERLVQQAGITAGQHVLDLGCGTATLTLLIKQTHRDAEVVGLDGDRKVLDIARAKIARAHMSVSLIQGDVLRAPFSR